ncbi:MAG: hypothetical protein JWR05_3533 [Mucilaginibacter sp.]|nr:hypothetical protein [Mucilaginibacter sp.]
MKKLILFSLIAFAFYSCSKNNNATPQSTTWISGKWRMTKAYDDTTANNQRYDTAVYPDELNFIDSTNVTSAGAAATFKYSLSTMTINEGGVIYHIKKTSNTTFTLTSYTAFVGFEQFTKE